MNLLNLAINLKYVQFCLEKVELIFKTLEEKLTCYILNIPLLSNVSISIAGKLTQKIALDEYDSYNSIFNFTFVVFL